MIADPPAALPPLTPDDFDAQDDALDRLRQDRADTPDWEFCEGFLAALVCCRRSISPEEYWPVLLGPAFRPMAHMEFVLRWRRRWAEVADALDAPVEELDDELCYHPEVLDIRGAVLDQADRPPVQAAQTPAYGQLWAHGFLTAVDAWPNEWRSPRDAEAASMLADALRALSALTSDDTGTPVLSMHREDGPPSISQARIDAFGEAIWAVYDLRQLWRSLGPRAVPQRSADTPGRNDPCPCGSGRKYKKCHGSA